MGEDDTIMTRFVIVQPLITKHPGITPKPAGKPANIGNCEKAHVRVRKMVECRFPNMTDPSNSFLVRFRVSYGYIWLYQC